MLLGGGECLKAECGEQLDSLLAAQDDPQYTTPSDASCKSISPAANDYWCQTNCLTGCPKDMCQCGGPVDAAVASPSPTA